MRRIISVILSLIAAVTFTFSTFSFAYAGGDKPKATYITGTSSVDGGFKVKYKTYDSVDGYQIRYSTKHDFENDKRVKVKDNSKGSKTVKGLKAKTTYFVKVRTYKYDGDKIIYSSWCDSEPISVEKATSKKKSTKKKSSSAKYYWVDDSKVYHTSKNCRTLKRSTSVSSGKKAPSGRRWLRTGTRHCRRPPASGIVRAAFRSFRSAAACRAAWPSGDPSCGGSCRT